MIAEDKLRGFAEDEDEYFISLETSHLSEPKPSGHGAGPQHKLGLDMKGIDTEFADSNEFGVQEQNVLVTFDLPDGSQASEHFKLGHTIELLKSFVATEFAIEMESQQLFLGDTLLLDPLTLLDYPEVLETDEIYIRVEGTMEEIGRK